jgi:hypothetical protein
MHDGLLLIGRKEFVEFPEWGLPRLRAKVDTGAFSSALGVTHYELWDEPGAGLRARIQPHRGAVITTPVLRLVCVTSSSGCRETRPLIEALVRLGPVTRTVRLTVTKRDGLRHRLILGRQALTGLFLVDVSRKYVLGGARSIHRGAGS